MRKSVMLLVLAGLLAAPVLADGTIRSRGIEPVLDVAGVAALQAEDGTLDHPRAKAAVTEFLGLTEAQVAEWDALWTAREDAVAPLRDQLKSTEEQLRELLKSESPDPGAVGTLVISGKTLRDGIVAAHKTYVDGFEAMLTAEQKAKLGAIRRAARLAPLVPAFAVFGLVPPPAA